MSQENQPIEVSHDSQAGCFEVVVDGHRAHLDYRQLDEQTLDYYHTFVPDALRGKGIAAILTRAALEYAQSKELGVVPSCSYVAVYMQRQAQQE